MAGTGTEGRAAGTPGGWRELLATLPGPAGPQADEPWVEVLALVWGPRFDREHLRGLLAARALPPTLSAVADRFDALAPVRQQRLRRLILRSGPGRCAAMGESPAWTASC